MSDELIGRVLGQYRIIELIGKSGAGRLYRAEQTGTGRAFALKILPSGFLDDAAFAAEFQAQAIPLTQLHHPNIVSLYEATVSDGYPYLVLGLVDGQSLSDRLAEMPGGLSAAEAARILTQVAAGLDLAHRSNVLHRNVKPSNILLDGSGVAALTNFGLPVVSEARSHHAGKRYIGTPAYMAPELTTGGEVGPLSDIYALGATFFHSLTTRPPFDSGNQVAVLLAHVQQPVPAIREYRPDLPIALQPVIERVMAKDPADRFQTASEFAASVDTVIRGMGPPAAKAPLSTGDPLSTARVQAATEAEVSTSTTVQIKPAQVKLPPLSSQELGVQTAGRRRSEPPPPAPSPAAPPADPEEKREAAAPTSKPTVVGEMRQADLGEAPAPSGKETVPADISRAGVQAARQAAGPATIPPAAPPKQRNNRLLIMVGLSALVVCLVAAAALMFLIVMGVLGS